MGFSEVFSMPCLSLVFSARVPVILVFQHTSVNYHLPHTSPQLLSAFIRSLAGECLETHRRRHFSLCEVCSFLHFHAIFTTFIPSSGHFHPIPLFWVFLLAFSLSSIFSACMSLRFTHCYSSSLAYHCIVTSSLLLFLAAFSFSNFRHFRLSERLFIECQRRVRNSDPEAANLIYSILTHLAPLPLENLTLS